MPSYATAVGFSTLSGVIGIALFNALGAIGGVIAGILVDKYHVTTVTLMCGIGSAVSVLLFWCFAVSESMLYVFAILYGLFAGSFTSTWSRSAGAIRIGGRNAETSSVLAFLIGGMSTCKSFWNRL
ncbi:MAG: hypothetical protein M1820_005738 [Bogoriella megaspora]|nr:MAG: hypothetical protein M1820_005738 [Bogoriella megaspora]